jgi:hypothetical protein
MSEYWKSTPKYWCKFCKVFVKDTKLERQQHDATPRHQGNIQRSLRSLHKDKEQEDRQKQRAKDEVARLNGLTGSGGGASASTAAKPGSVAKDTPKQATLEERKRQMKQLADMGIAVPDEFRREMGMASDWQTVKVTRIERPPEDEDSKDAVAFGVRKRKFEDQEEEEAILGTGDAAAEVKKNRSWGARMKTFPGSGRKGGKEDDIDALLGGVVVKKAAVKEEEREVDGQDASTEAEGATGATVADATGTEAEKELPPLLKRSDSDDEQAVAETLGTLPDVKTEGDASEVAASTPGAGIVFKKRKKIVR